MCNVHAMKYVTRVQCISLSVSNFKSIMSSERINVLISNFTQELNDGYVLRKQLHLETKTLTGA